MQYHLQRYIEKLPIQAGVYLFKDNKDTIIYIGKAKQLRKRVQSYFRKNTSHDKKISVMVNLISKIESILASSEQEALKIECNLIKQYRPRYNIIYRDDKSFPYICITREEQPRIFPTRTLYPSHHKYIGPYDNVHNMKKMITFVRKAFNLCTCAISDRINKQTQHIPKWRSCVQMYVNSCSKDIDKEEYQIAIKRAENILLGKSQKIIRELKEEMEIASQSLAFEHATILRDAIYTIEAYQKNLKTLVTTPVNYDICATHIDPNTYEVCTILIKIREGKLIGRFYKYLSLKHISHNVESQLLQVFLENHYITQKKEQLPDKVLCSHQLNDEQLIYHLLEKKKSISNRITTPQSGEKKQLVNLALLNAKHLLIERKNELLAHEEAYIPHTLKQLYKQLNLKHIPRRIECFDNSNLMGSAPVASMVMFIDGKLQKKLSRLYHIKTVVGIDDFKSMYEIVYRRYRKLVQTKQTLPNLIIIDGGKGQLHSAWKALCEVGIQDSVDIIGLAKRLEEVILINQNESTFLNKHQSPLRLIQQIRDETHKKAINFHRKSRTKINMNDSFLHIRGIGTNRLQQIYDNFGSIKQALKMEVKSWQKLFGPTLGKTLYENVKNNYFKKKSLEPTDSFTKKNTNIIR